MSANTKKKKYEKDDEGEESGTDLERTAEKWFEAKEKLRIIEDKIERYKQAFIRALNAKNEDRLVEGGFVVSRRRITKTYVSKETLPSDVWKQYATTCNYDMLLLSRRRTADEKSPRKASGSGSSSRTQSLPVRASTSAGRSSNR